MNKEPIGLYIFRFVVGLGLFVFMMMLYWSSVLIEERMQQLQNSFSSLENRLLTQPEARAPPHQEPQPPTPQTSTANWPNLLTPDPFYATTLPKLLPTGFKPASIRRGAIVSRPDNLHPFNNWSHISGWVSQCSVAVASMHVGRYETLGPDMALKLEERPIAGTDRTEFWIHLRPDVFWQPLTQEMVSQEIHLSPHFLRKHPVTAEDFKFYFDAVMNPWVQSPGAVALRNYLSDIEEFRIIDPLTFVVRWKAEPLQEADGQLVPKVKYIAKMWTGELRPLASFVYKYFPDGTKILEEDAAPDSYRSNSSWAQQFNQHWAKNVIPSCGPWIFKEMTDRQISFVRNPDHYDPLAVLVEGMEIQFKESDEGVWQDFKAGKTDLYELRPDQLLDLQDFLASETYKQQAATPELAIKRLDYVSLAYTYIGWNMAKRFFDDKRVRQAMTLAIDRKRIIEKNLNGLGITINGPFFRYSKAYDDSIAPWPYDPQEARRHLEAAGWFDSKGTGILDKEFDGERIPFRFTLTYYVKNPTSQAIGEYISLALKEIGIDCHLNGVEIADLSAVFDDKNFDALFLGWSLGAPPEEPKQLWDSSGAKEKGSSNAVGFANTEADKIIHELQYTYDEQKRIALYHRFDAILHDEQPYTFLYTPKAIFLYRNYVQNVFVPAERQDLIPGADVTEPQPGLFWLLPHG